MSPEKVAVIGGTGDLGFGLALRWALAGVQVRIGSREGKKAQDAAERAKAILKTAPGAVDAPSHFVEGLQNTQAVAGTSVVVLTVPFPAQVSILKSIRSSLRDAILVDATVPLAATVGGRAARLLGVWQGSAAEQARELVAPGTPVLAAFHSLAADLLQDLTQQPDCDVLVCGNDEEAKQRLFPLIKFIPGLQPVDAGPLEMARIAEAITPLLISLNRRYRVPHAGIRITGLEHSP